MSNSMLPISAEYMAGMVDADGSISIFKQDTSARRNPVYRVGITVTNYNTELLGDIQSQFGGYINNYEGTSELNGDWKSIFWSQYGKKARPILTEITPFLRIKRQQADLCLEFLNLMDRQLEHNGGRLLTDSDIEYREDLFQKYRSIAYNRNNGASENQDIIQLSRTDTVTVVKGRDSKS